MKSLTKSQIVETTQLTLRQVQFYTEEGVVIPEVVRGEGRGKARRYSWENLVYFLLIKELSDYGMTLSKIKTILDYVKSNEQFNDYTKNKMHRAGLKLFLAISKKEDGATSIRWIGIPRSKLTSIVLIDSDLKEINSTIVINYTNLLKKADI